MTGGGRWLAPDLVLSRSSSASSMEPSKLWIAAGSSPASLQHPYLMAWAQQPDTSSTTEWRPSSGRTRQPDSAAILMSGANKSGWACVGSFDRSSETTQTRINLVIRQPALATMHWLRRPGSNLDS